MNKFKNLVSGTLCIYTQTGNAPHNGYQEIVEFKYIGQTGTAIICPPGERDTQSSWSVNIESLTPLRVQPGKRYEFDGMLVTACEYVDIDEVRVKNSSGNFFSTHETNLKEL